MSKGLDINRIVRVTNKAFNQTADLLSPKHESDSQLRMYNQLKPDHFKGLAGRFGHRTVEKYIKEMEARRMGVE